MDQKDSAGKHLDNQSLADKLLRQISQDRLFANESISSLKYVRFNKKEFSARKLISNIKCYYPGS